MNPSRPWGISGITLIAALMMIFGLAEIATAFMHDILGHILIGHIGAATYAAAVVGALYAICGLLLVTMGEQATKFAMACLIALAAGRIALAMTGLYPLTSLTQLIFMFIGIAFAIAFATYIAIK